jgi:CheY-like chemotaxis protein
MPQENKLNVLMIDDDPDDNFLFQEAVSQTKLPINVSFACDNKSVFNYINANSPDVILLDINMPAKDGMEYLKELKSTDQYKHIPVIMFSTSKHMMEDCFNCGASKYFVKPNSFEDMRKLVEKIDNRLWTSTSTSVSDGFVLDYSQ